MAIAIALALVFRLAVALKPFGTSEVASDFLSRSVTSRGDVAAAKRPPPHNQTLDNHGDMQYTGKIKVGGQEVNAIIDTGSFELLVFSTRCAMCGHAEKLYAEDHSKSYRVGGLLTEHSFGSGSTESVEAFETIEIGDMKTKKQVFWEVISAAMPVLSEASFQAILGVGPPSSAVGMALEDEEAAQELYDNHATDETRSDVKHYAEVVDHAKSATSLAANMDLKTFSFCLERKSGNPGWFIWHDLPPRERPKDQFSTVQVVGDLYWSAELSDVRLGITDETLATGGMALGCQKEACSAVFDSGTSLLSAPPQVVDMIEDVLAKRDNPQGDCTNLKGLPDLEFTIAGQPFSLPPTSYVGEIEDVLTSDLVHLMPHLREKERRKGCVPVLMTLDADSQFGALWVMGMPFFRKYYSTFHLESGDMPRPAAKSMSFAKHDGHCRPKAPSLFRAVPDMEDEQGPMRVDLSKLHAPRWVQHAAHQGRIHI